MKKLLCSALAASAGLACGAASAQSNVTIYGIVDTGVEYATNADAAGNSVWRMPTLTGTLPSRIGFKGSEDLGGGMKAVFALENGFGPDNGTLGQAGRLFGRQAYVGLDTPYGTFTFGRLYTMSFFAGFKADVMGPAIHAIGTFDTYLYAARSDNSAGYWGKFGDFTVAGTYSLGRDTAAAGANCAGEVAGNSKACRQVSALLGYDNNSWGATTAYDIMYGNTGATGGLTSSAFYDERIHLNGYVMLGKTKFGAGLLKRTTHTAADTKSDLYFAGISYPLAANLVLDTQVSRLDVKNSPNDGTLVTARLTYNLSKRTAVYTSVGHMNNGGTAAYAVDGGGTVGAGMSQNGIMAGVRHFF